MDYRLDPLWLKLNMMNAQGLQAFAPLMQMMEKQMGANAEMAQRVVEEYRKFLFLAMRAGHQVIPPGIIPSISDVSSIAVSQPSPAASPAATEAVRLSPPATTSTSAPRPPAAGPSRRRVSSTASGGAATAT